MAYDKKLLSELLKKRTSKENRKARSDAVGILAAYAKKNNLPYSRGSDPEPWILIGKGLWNPKYGALCHVDTVGSYFPARIIKDKLFCRGALDMKGPLVASLSAMEGKDNVSVLVTSDEETGGRTAAALSRRFRPSASLVVPDGGADFRVTIEEKGVLHFKTTTKGKAAHGSRPWLGHNAIDAAFEKSKELREVLSVDNGEGWHNTLVLSRISAGSGTNVVPDLCETYYDFRYITHDSGYWKRMISDTCGKAEFIAEGERTSIPEDDPELLRFRSIVKKVTGRSEVCKATGASDARHFKRIKSKIITYPKGGGAHGAEEWVSILSLEKLTLILGDYWS